MRVLAHAETSARAYLDHRVDTGQISRQEADTIFGHGFRLATQVIANLRRHKLTNEGITSVIEREQQRARLHYGQAVLTPARETAYRRLLIAEVVHAVWTGMQEDVAAYQQQ